MFGGQHGEHDAAPMKLRDISAIDEPRIDMRDEELNRVLGGGMVPAASRSWAVNRESVRVRSPCRLF